MEQQQTTQGTTRLTQFELKHPRLRYNAGAASFQAGFLQSANPYKTKNERENWEKGYRSAKKFFETGRPVQSDKPRHFKRPGAQSSGFTPRRIENFNNRYRTVA